MRPGASPARPRGYDPAAAADWGARVAAADRRERDRLARVEVDPYTGVARGPAPAETTARTPGAVVDPTIGPGPRDPTVAALARAVSDHVLVGGAALCSFNDLFGRYVVSSSDARVEIEARLLDDPERAASVEPIARAAALLVGGCSSVILPADVVLCRAGVDERGCPAWRLEPYLKPAAPAVDEAAFLRLVKSAVPVGVPVAWGTHGQRFLAVALSGAFPHQPQTIVEVEREALADGEGPFTAAVLIGDFCFRRRATPMIDGGLRLVSHRTRDVWVVAHLLANDWP